MAILNTKQRDSLDSDQFLMPRERKLPVHDIGHWRAARGRISNVKGLTEDQQQALIQKWERIGRRRGWLKSSSEQLSDITFDPTPAMSEDNPWKSRMQKLMHGYPEI